jgi:hypothetical protein
MDENLTSINTSLFITNEMNAQKEHYRWSPPEEIETHFGVEIESCIKINPRCIRIKTKENKERLNILRDLNILSFKDKFDFYYNSIIINSPYFEDLAEEYKYLVIESLKGEETLKYYYDMKNPEQPGMAYHEMRKWEYTKAGLVGEYGQNLAYQIVDNTIKEIEDNASSYRIPLFVEDISIVCGDNRHTPILNKEKAGVLDIHSFRFECVTPILRIDGYPTKDKIDQVLYPLLSLYGLDRPACFIQNYSMGFHVNASLYNKKHGKYIAIAEPPFLNRLLRNYIKVEKDIYRAVRPRGIARAPVNYFSRYNQPGYKDYARPLSRNLEFFKRINIDNLNTLEAFDNHTLRSAPIKAANAPNTNTDEIINRIMTKKDYINFKYKGVKRKSPFLLEFRLFEGEIETGKLVTHVFTALDILHKTANEVSRISPLNLALNDPNNNTYPNNNSVDPTNLNRDGYSGGRRRRKTIKKKKYRHKTRKT